MPVWAGCVVRRLDTVDSTNLYARKWAREGAPHGAVVIADRQTAGRGRRGRGWLSPSGTGLWLSMVVRPDIPDEAYPLLPLAAALATADACEAVSHIPVRIKWPNDLIAGGRKIVGILAEREGDSAVIGIGINVRHQLSDFPPEFRDRAGSLEMASGEPISLPELEHELLYSLEAHLFSPSVFPEYAARCATVGSEVRVSSLKEDFTGVAESLDDTGALLVRDEHGILHRVLAGDVSVRGIMGYL
ncbi:biotin--[acetyl-CoA-carboxylase] ligase [Eubacteriales bacterium OttesenSCG-928-A19]|nr:biotin--[acetyl-CoA-carboxylase] ligase [Eubacteriales bacterium OttesenSCG-928-A19]